MSEYQLKQIRAFEWKDLHKKKGTIIIVQPSEIDLEEGYFMNQVWFMDSETKIIFLLNEYDIREKGEEWNSVDNQKGGKSY